ncbi:cyclo-L-Trp-L-Trp prenyltransferase [Aspergillus affinis]|uniref:cyclo-L-Trp-L-Trp prenyltransferase n=1 Tax=Aspergillus affinis TaxID=1070780 RepID=UPI0022FDB2EB|nr:cyclo-L-Trp-L-Trp prenyltransferase [Aspergillus affinis]KAI9035397.1 cyclo-L-Trp-L-Trp prenyltransferase [Aspergillus affinis]
MMGPFPSLGRPGLYTTPFVGMGTLELSTNFVRSKTTVRMSMEPISYRATTGPGLFNRIMLGRMLNRLKHAGVAVDLPLYHQLVHRPTLSDEEEAAFPKCDEKRNLPYNYQVAVVLDFANEDAAVRAVDKEESFKYALAVLKNYFTKLPSSISVHWICFDLVNPKTSRFKIYLLDHQVDFQRVANLWTLDDVLASAENSKGLDLLRELWEGLKISDGLRKSTANSDQADIVRESLCILANYECQPGRSLLQPKIYVLLSGMSEIGIAKVVSSFMQRHLNAE